MIDPTIIRDQVREYLKSHPIPQKQLAADLGVSLSWISKFLRGDFNNPTVERLSHLQKWVQADVKKRLNN